jgi:hypothetical protein
MFDDDATDEAVVRRGEPDAADGTKIYNRDTLNVAPLHKTLGRARLHDMKLQ